LNSVRLSSVEHKPEREREDCQFEWIHL